MKHLQDLLIEEIAFNNKKEWKFDHLRLGYSFKDFVNENDIADDALCYARKIFDSHHWNFGYGEMPVDRYYIYQELFYEKLNENNSEDKTKYVNDQEYIYHVTDKENLESILKYGIQPKDKNEDYHKIYILVKNKNFEEHLQSLIGDKSEKILLTIDLSKKRNQNKFFLDDGATGYDAYYTREEIPEYCIIKHEII